MRWPTRSECSYCHPTQNCAPSPPPRLRRRVTPPPSQPVFVTSVDAGVVSVDPRVVSVEPRGNWV
jgi:hypothetical protein